ncbi:MAG TPA: phosphoribosyltransferase family protein [Chloroflexota bacterium]|jgi:hypoxanthine phosphoribosyltransferase
MDKVHLTWDDVQECVSRIIRQLDRDYDCMLVVTRGGLVPACLISEQIGLRNILVAAVMFYTGMDERLEAPIFLQFPADQLLAGKKILVIDDVWDSGRTITAVKARVEESQGRPTIAVLHFKPSRSQFPNARPDVFGKESGDWLVYPWDPESRYRTTSIVP